MKIAEKVAAAIEAIPAPMRAMGLDDAHPWPRATRGNSKIGRRVSPKRAWRRRRLEVNPPNATKVIILDLDHDGLKVIPWPVQDGSDPMSFKMTYRLGGRFGQLLLPSWIVQNDLTGKAHVGYVLETAVHHNRYSRRAPQNWLVSIVRRLRRKWAADRDYNGILTRNPHRPGPDCTAYLLRQRPFALAEIAASLPPEPRVWVSKTPTTHDSCRLYHESARTAFKPRHARPILDGELTARAVVDQVNAEIADSQGKLLRSESEVKSIAKQIHKRLHRYWSEDVLSERQRKRALWGAEKKRQAPFDRNRLIWRMKTVGSKSVPKIEAYLATHPDYGGSPDPMRRRLAIKRRQIYRVLEQGRVGAWENRRRGGADSFVKFLEASDRLGKGFPQFLTGQEPALPVKADDTPTEATEYQEAHSPHNGRKWPLARAPGRPRQHPATPHTPNADQAANDLRRRAADVVTLARELVTRLKAEGDAEGLARARRMLREQHGIDCE